jgi:hypothetical protein
MKNLKYKIGMLIGIFTITVLAVACDDQGYDDYNAGGTPTQALNGEWFIDVLDADGNVLVPHALHKTYDTNDGDGTMYISDRAPGADATSTDPLDFTGWVLDSKVDTNIQGLTFTANEAANAGDGSVVTITNGKILKGAGHSRTGVATDSIYFEGEFDYDPGNKIIFAGHRRTGFDEDEY